MKKIGISRPLHRKPKQRSIPVDLIVCEGETEIDYLRELAKWKRVSIDIKKSKGTDPMSVVTTAKKCSKDYDKIFCMFDKDYHAEIFFQAIEMCLKLGFIPVISNPCIEVWFLKHFLFRQAALGGPKETLNALRKHLPKYEKDGVITFYETYPLIDTACRNAKNLNSRKQDQFHQDPYTNVDRIILRLDEIQVLKS